MNYILPSPPSGKIAGQFYTPAAVAQSLVSWVVREQTDRLLDPSCGDGAILSHHRNSRGIEQDPYAAWRARQLNADATIDVTDFFSWAVETTERFPCAAGNPPFIRFQNFKGTSKAAALRICQREGFKLSGLSSAWAAFLLATVSLLSQDGRMAFVVPAEIGHATYAPPIIEYLLGAFSRVQVIAVREKLFPGLSEDCWLLYCEGRGGSTTDVHFTQCDRFRPSDRPPNDVIGHDWQELKRECMGRLRPLLISTLARAAYRTAAQCPETVRLGEFATVGIGYITGDNDYFHFTPRRAEEHGIPPEFLVRTIRRGRDLLDEVINNDTVARWHAANEPFYLLQIPPTADLPSSVIKYLESEQGLQTRKRFKCRTRPFWYSVPGVTYPDYFLQYMSGANVRISRNDAYLACTNSVHAVHITDAFRASVALPTWSSDLTRLSCEIEGHPLGGGMLKLEPREASKLLFSTSAASDECLQEAIAVLKRWRHIDV